MREADAFEIVGMRKMEESPVSARKKGRHADRSTRSVLEPCRSFFHD